MPTSPLNLRPVYPGNEGGAAVPRDITTSPHHVERLAYDADNPVDIMDTLIKALDKAQLPVKSEAEKLRVRVKREWEDRGTEVVWDWKPAARHIQAWIETTLSDSPTNVWMVKRPGGPIELNFQMSNTSRFAQRWNQGKFKTLRGQLNRKFQMTPSYSEALYTLPNGQMVEVNIFVGGTPSGERLAGLRQRTSAQRVASSHLAEFRSYIAARSANVNIFDGWRKQKVLNALNALLSKHTKGYFRDNVWAPIQAIRKDFEDENIPAEQLPGTGVYEKEDGRDVRKVWKYKVPFLNQNGRLDAVYISITASGGGPVDDPLTVYDVVAYAS